MSLDYGELFLDSNSGKCFWILGRVLDSGKCLWILGRVLDSGKCFVPTSHRTLRLLDTLLTRIKRFFSVYRKEIIFRKII